MKRIMLTLVLAIAAGVWMTSKAMCQVSTCTCLFDDPPVAISGILQLVPLPCPESTEDIPCPPCLTIALNANEQLYYLNGLNDNLNALLDTLVYPVNATVTGHVYTAVEDGLAIRVQDISLHASLPSLCDEWNVLEISNVTCGYCEEYRTYNFHLTTDTVIGGLLYSQLIEDGAYKGALREGNNRDIYCIPAGCSQEYLLYAFNAQVGDSLKNIWVGGYSSWIPDVRSAIVSEIKQTTPRTIELEVHYYEAPDAYEESIRNLTWIEGIGMPFGPMGAECSVFNGCADSRAKLLLCAYKNGEQVYVSEWGELYGCEANSVDKTKELLIGEWQVYKEIVKGVNESGEPIHETRTYDVDNGDVHWLFEENIVYDAICSTCYCIPAPYTLVRSNMNITQCILTIEGKYDTQNPSDSSVVGRSPITICNQTENTMEWSFMVYRGNEKPDIYYQYLRRYPYATHTDTIPLFIKDGPGSSTVEPVDPNLIYATLSKDILSIYAKKDLEINMILYKVPSANHAPAVKRAIKATTFTDSISTTLTESGTYTLELTHSAWDYTIVGTFDYQLPQAVENTPANTPSATKILKDGRLFLRYKGQMYNVQGQQVQ